MVVIEGGAFSALFSIEELFSFTNKSSRLLSHNVRWYTDVYGLFEINS